MNADFDTFFADMVSTFLVTPIRTKRHLIFYVGAKETRCDYHNKTKEGSQERFPQKGRVVYNEFDNKVRQRRDACEENSIFTAGYQRGGNLCRG